MYKLLLWNLKRKKPYTMTALAEKIGVSKMALYHWKSGQVPSAKNALKIEEITGGKVKRKDFL